MAVDNWTLPAACDRGGASARSAPIVHGIWKFYKGMWVVEINGGRPGLRVAVRRKDGGVLHVRLGRRVGAALWVGKSSV